MERKEGWTKGLIRLTQADRQQAGPRARTWQDPASPSHNHRSRDAKEAQGSGTLLMDPSRSGRCSPA